MPAKRRMPAFRNSFDQMLYKLCVMPFAAELGNAVLAVQPVEHEADFVLPRNDSESNPGA